MAPPSSSLALLRRLPTLTKRMNHPQRIPAPVPLVFLSSPSDLSPTMPASSIYSTTYSSASRLQYLSSSFPARPFSSPALSTLLADYYDDDSEPYANFEFASDESIPRFIPETKVKKPKAEHHAKQVTRKKVHSTKARKPLKSKSSSRQDKHTRQFTGLTQPLVADPLLFPILCTLHPNKPTPRIISRSQLLQHFNHYAKFHNLVGSDKAQFRLDPQLQHLFGTAAPYLPRAELLKRLKPFLRKPTAQDESDPKLSQEIEAYKSSYLNSRNWNPRGSPKNSSKQRQTTQKKLKTGLFVEYRLNQPLAEVCNLLFANRLEIQKRIWMYIKEGELQEVGNRGIVRVDWKLGRLNGLREGGRVRFTRVPAIISLNVLEKVS